MNIERYFKIMKNTLSITSITSEYYIYKYMKKKKY